MYFICNYLWVIATDVRVYDTRSAKVENILPLDKIFQLSDKGVIVYNSELNVYSSSGVLLHTISCLENVIDVLSFDNTLIIGQESLITIYTNNQKMKEITTTELVKLTLFRDKIVVVSQFKIRFYKLQESLFKKNCKEFKIQELQDIIKVISTLDEIIIVSKLKITVYVYKMKDLVLDKEIMLDNSCVDAYLKEEELLLLHVNDISSVDLKKGKKEIKVPDFEFSKNAKESLKRFCSCGEFVRGEYQTEKNQISRFLSSNKYFSETKKRSWDLLALLKDKRCEIWDPWSKKVLTSLDFTEYFKKTDIENVILNSRFLLVLGGTTVVVYTFITSVNIEMATKMEQDLERAMASLDNVVDSALKEAKNVKELLTNTGDVSSKVDGNDHSELEMDTTEMKSELTPSELIGSNANNNESDVEQNFYTVGNVITEMYDCNYKVPGWYPLCKIVTDQIISNVILDLDTDLIVVHSMACDVKIARISNPSTFLSVDVQSQKSVSLMSFAKIFLPNGEISPFLICVTLDGTIAAFHVDVSDPMEIVSGPNVTIQQSISESPVAIYILDDNGNLQQKTTGSREFFLICVFKQSIRIFLFRDTGSHELFHQIKTDSKDGMIVKSGVFANDTGSFLGILFTSGILHAYSLPDLSVAFKNKMECDIRFIEDCFISSIGYVYVWSSLDKLDIFELAIAQKEEEATSHLYVMESKNPRETLKNVVRERLGADDTKSNGADGSKSVSNELQMKMNERGEALQALETKFSDLSAGTSEFLKKIKDYNEQQVPHKH